METEEAELAVADLTGGLFVALDFYADARSRGSSYTQVLEVKDRNVAIAMQDAGLSVSHPVFRELVRDGRIDTTRPVDLGMANAYVKELLAANILSVHPDQTYTFHDRHVAKWFHRQLQRPQKRSWSF